MGMRIPRFLIVDTALQRLEGIPEVKLCLWCWSCVWLRGECLPCSGSKRYQRETVCLLGQTRYVVVTSCLLPTSLPEFEESSLLTKSPVLSRYHGEKLQLFGQLKRPRGTGLGLISTIYDEPLPQDQRESLLRRQPPTSMKFRTDVTFVKSSSCALDRPSEPE